MDLDLESDIFNDNAAVFLDQRTALNPYSVICTTHLNPELDHHPVMTRSQCGHEIKHRSDVHRGHLDCLGRVVTTRLVITSLTNEQDDHHSEQEEEDRG